MIWGHISGLLYWYLEYREYHMLGAPVKKMGEVVTDAGFQLCSIRGQKARQHRTSDMFA